MLILLPYCCNQNSSFAARAKQEGTADGGKGGDGGDGGSRGAPY